MVLVEFSTRVLERTTPYYGAFSINFLNLQTRGQILSY